MSIICKNTNRRQEIECINCDCSLKYIPCIGHSVIASRKELSEIYTNSIIGPVVDTWSNACRILNNPGTSAELDVRLHFNEWNFKYLHDTE